MTTALLLLAAAAYLGRGWLTEAVAAAKSAASKWDVNWQNAIAVVLVAAAAASFVASGRGQQEPTPAPAPGPQPGSLVLRGRFIGPTAGQDAARLAGLCDAIADCVEWDGMREGGPRLTTGVAIDDLRVAARDARMKGESIGDRQPDVKAAIGTYLARPDVLGTSGGPIGPDERSRWVAAFRAVARACEDATR